MALWDAPFRARSAPDQIVDLLPARQLADLMPDGSPRRLGPRLPAAPAVRLSVPGAVRLLDAKRWPRAQRPTVQETVERLEAAREAAERLGGRAIRGRSRRRVPMRRLIAVGLLGGAAATYAAWTLRGRATHFHFITDWFIPAPPEEVWKLLSDSRTYPEWWPTVYLDVQPYDQSPEPRLGARFHYYTRGRLPYKLHWDVLTTEVDPPRAIAVRATGDFVGTARWTIQPALGGSKVRLDWELVTEKPLLRLLNPIARPLLKWNHRWAMAQGEAGLRSRLATAH